MVLGSVWSYLLTITLASCCSALLVAAALRRAFEFSSPGKRMNSLEIEIADLRSSMQTLLESHKKLRSRIGMRELRERQGMDRTADRGGPPPPGATKAQLRDYYLRGKTPADVAMSAMTETEQ